MFGNRVVCKTTERFDMIKQNEKKMIRNTTDASTQKTILRQVNKVQRSKQARDRRFSWLVGVAVLATMMLVAMIVESQLNLFSHTLRFGLTILSLTAAVVCTWKLWNRGQRANSRMVSAAKDIDATYPAMQERVSTLTSCNEDRLESQQLVHPAMLSRLTEETATLHENVKPKSIVSYRMLRLPLVWLSVAALVLLGFFAWDTPKTLVQLGRFFAPWADLSTTQVTAVDADQVVARNEPYKLTAAMSGRIVDEIEFFSKNIDGTDSSKTRLWPTAKDKTLASVRQSKASDSFDYLFRAGDGETDWHRVTVADRPKIEDLTVRIVPPEYTGKSTKTYHRLPKKLRVVAGSRLEVEVKPKSDVRTARLVMGKTDWLPMALSAGGIYDGALDLWQPVDFKVQLTELHGLINRRPPGCRLQVVADQAPKVKILKPTKTAVLMPDEAIDIHFKASDDFGIKKMALRVSTLREGEDQPTVHEVPIPLDENTDRRKIKGVVQLDLAQFNLKDGDAIQYEIRVSDNFRPLENELEPNDIESMKDVKMAQAKSPADGTKGTVAKSSQGTKSSQATEQTEQTTESTPAEKLSQATKPGPQVPTTEQSDWQKQKRPNRLLVISKAHLRHLHRHSSNRPLTIPLPHLRQNLLGRRLRNRRIPGQMIALLRQLPRHQSKKILLNQPLIQSLTPSLAIQQVIRVLTRTKFNPRQQNQNQTMQKTRSRMRSRNLNRR